MVFFSCCACGDALKKNRVEKHYFTKCRTRPAVTCLDCLKDFTSTTYESHNKCISEEERYAAKGFVPKPTANKGEKKQGEMLRLLNKYLKENKVDKNVKQILLHFVNIENVPLRKKPLINLLENHGVFKHYCGNAHEEVWAVIEEINSTIAKQNAEKVPDKVSDVDDSKNIQEVEDINMKSSELESGKPEKENGSSCDVGVLSVEENLKTLSKKERKEKRKKEKYAKELQEIETQNQREDEVPHTAVEVEDRPKRKRKHALQNGDSNLKNCVEDTNEPMGKKKKKKIHEQKENDDGCILNQEVEEAVASCTKESEPDGDMAAETKTKKFNWEETIISVLQHKKELPLKRLQKKVVNEYLSSGTHVKSVDKAVAKFNKKVLKISSVKVKKEVAKLVL